jgi:aldose 1-epimerase
VGTHSNGQRLRRIIFIWLLSGMTMHGTKGWAAEATRRQFGTLADGTAVEAVELSNASGMRARIIALGATLQALHVPDRNGRVADVVLGYASAREYLEKPQYFGVTVGRYANRIAGGRFALDGRTYTVEKNDGPNHLHGGVRGFDKALWRIESVSHGQEARVTLSHVSPDGDSGYPGKLRVTAMYSLNDLNELTIEYRARTDKPTIVNLTNHSYFNLAGEDSTVDALDHRLTLFADAYTPVDQTLIPTGERRPVEGSVFDFRTPRTIGERIRDASEAQLLIARGYDHNFIVNGSPGTLRPAARLEDPVSGRIMELLVTAPAVQFYTGNFLNGTTAGKSGHIYRQSDAVCLEPQTFPDSPNRPDFPSARLDPGQEYVSTMVFRFPGVKR